jgi:oligoendopeptidase F
MPEPVEISIAVSSISEAADLLALQRQLVQERLERRSSLAQRRHAIDFRAARVADVGEDFTAGVIQHDHRAIVHVAAIQRRQLLAQHHLRVALQARIQRAAHRLSAARQQLLRHLRRRRQLAAATAGGSTPR